KGGKGVATSAGVFGALAPWAMLCAVGVFVVVAAASRYVSLASVCATIALVPLVIAFGGADRAPLVALVSAVAVTVVVRHATNLRRIAAGTEPKIGSKKTKEAPVENVRG